jgi:DNA-binding HxlR family transcriptional regulator
MAAKQSEAQEPVPVCPIARAAGLFGDHWTLLILRDLEGGCRRFRALESSTGMSPGVLSGRLRTLEGAGIITRRQYSEIPPRVEYTLTEKGRAALPIISQLRTFGETWLMDDVVTGPESEE